MLDLIIILKLRQQLGKVWFLIKAHYVYVPILHAYIFLLTFIQVFRLVMLQMLWTLTDKFEIECNMTQICSKNDVCLGKLIVS